MPPDELTHLFYTLSKMTITAKTLLVTYLFVCILSSKHGSNQDILLHEAQDADQFGDENNIEAEGNAQQLGTGSNSEPQGAIKTSQRSSNAAAKSKSSTSKASTRANAPESSVDQAEREKTLEIVKTGSNRGYYTKEEMDFLIRKPNPSAFCKHIVDPVNIWKDPGKREENLIGKGGFGRVYKGIYTSVDKNSSQPKKTFHEVAVKYVPYVDKTAVSLLKEINFMRRMSISRHHLPFYKCFYELAKDRQNKEDKRPQIILMMALMKGDTDAMVKNQQKRNEMLKTIKWQTFMVDMAKGIRDMHWMGVLHRDIKLDNFLINKYNNPIVADLGLSEFVADGVSGLAGTPYYLAPEVLVKGTKYGLPVDVYSLGITFYAFLVGARPNHFVEFQLPQGAAPGKSVVYFHLLKTSKYLGLIQAMCAQDPASRPKMEEVVKDLADIAANKPSKFPAQPVVQPPPGALKRSRNLEGKESRLNAFVGDSIFII